MNYKLHVTSADTHHIMCYVCARSIGKATMQITAFVLSMTSPRSIVPFFSGNTHSRWHLIPHVCHGIDCSEHRQTLSLLLGIHMQIVYHIRIIIASFTHDFYRITIRYISARFVLSRANRHQSEAIHSRSGYIRDNLSCSFNAATPCDWCVWEREWRQAGNI